jgi:hypothetical protein
MEPRRQEVRTVAKREEPTYRPSFAPVLSWKSEPSRM